MRKISYEVAGEVEATIKNLYNVCSRGGLCGLTDASHFEAFPFDAVLLSIPLVWQLETDKTALSEFVQKWYEELRIGGNGEVSDKSDEFKNELDSFCQFLLE